MPEHEFFGLVDADDIGSDTIAPGRLPVGTGSNQVSAGNHTHSGVYQPIDTDLTDMAGASPNNDDVWQRKGGVWVPRNMSQLMADLGGVSKTLVDAKGDLLVGTANDTVARKAVGSAGQLLIPDSAQSDGLRWATPRADSLSREWAEAVYGDKVASISRILADTAVAMQSGVRSWSILIGRVQVGDSFTGFRLNRAVAMVSGAATANLYTHTDVNGTTWSQVGSNVSCALNGTGIVSTACGFTAGDDVWVRLVLTLTTAPSTYPQLFVKSSSAVGTASLSTSGSGAGVFGIANITSAPASTHTPGTSYLAAAYMPFVALY